MNFCFQTESVASVRRSWATQNQSYLQLPLLLLGSIALAGCGGSSTNHSATQQGPLSPLAQLGEKIFHDTSLSASGRMSCATCHDEQHAFAQTNQEVVSLGGPSLDQPGMRNTPSLKYLSFTPSFHFDKDGTPIGGFNRDGRANTMAEQAIAPFLTSFEMANSSAEEVVDKLSHASYVGDFKKQFGDQIFADAVQAFLAAREALQAYEMEDSDFRPFTSKFDFFLDGKINLGDQELRGLALFNDPDKGNCTACHPSAMTNKQHPLFTDFSYDNLGVPRNSIIHANNDPDYFDLGLCGPLRTDLSTRKDLCGAFKVPTLRNIALTAPYFHNGTFNTLKEVVTFYVRRDTNPEDFYPLDNRGAPKKFDDLSSGYFSNVNIAEAPYNRHEGESPALSSDEIDAVVAFLNTLTDGYQP